MTTPTDTRCLTCGELRDVDCKHHAGSRFHFRAHEETTIYASSCVHTHVFPAPSTTDAVERPLNELWQMLYEVEDNAFLGYKERWGEPFPAGDRKQSSRFIEQRIEAAIVAREQTHYSSLSAVDGEYIETLQARIEALEAVIGLYRLGYRPGDWPLDNALAALDKEVQS